MQKLQYPKPFVLSLSKGRPFLSTPRKKNSPSTSSGRTEGGKTMSFLFPHALNLPLQLDARSEEHTSELQSLMRISYAVFCLKKKKPKNDNQIYSNNVHKTKTNTKN